jgi:hypothetical protein
MLSMPGIFTNQYSALFKPLKPLIALRSAHAVFPICFVKQLKCLQNFYQVCNKISHTRSWGSFIVTLSLIWWTACARAQFSWCSSMANAHSKTGQMAVCCQKLTLGALSSRSTSVLVGALCKTFGLFEHTSYIKWNTDTRFGPHVIVIREHVSDLQNVSNNITLNAGSYFLRIWTSYACCKGL